MWEGGRGLVMHVYKGFFHCGVWRYMYSPLKIYPSTVVSILISFSLGISVLGFQAQGPVPPSIIPFSRHPLHITNAYLGCMIGVIHPSVSQRLGPRGCVDGFDRTGENSRIIHHPTLPDYSCHSIKIEDCAVE